MALLTTLTLASETLANSLGATANALTVVATAGQINLAAAAANTQNGNVFRISVAGIVPPINFGSESVFPPVVLSVLVGANGNIADQVVGTVSLPTYATNGVWSADAVLTCRKNSTFSGGTNANSQWVCVINNITNPIPYTQTPEIAISGVASNGAVNVSLQTAAGAYTSNLANISVAVGLNTSQNGNAFVESCIINQAF
jgi:hypothetical protein